MKLSNFIVFLTVVLFLYFGDNYYLLRRGWQAIPRTWTLRGVFVFIMILLIMAYPLGRILEHYHTGMIVDFLVCVGSYWLAMMLYLTLGALILDFGRFMHSFFPYMPDMMVRHYPKVKFISSVVILLIALMVVYIGHVNAGNPRVKSLEVDIYKANIPQSEVSIVLVTDIHAGMMVGPERLKKMKDIINALGPDIVLFGGDIVDEDLGPVMSDGFGPIIKEIKAPLGIFAVTGNHEFFGGADAAVAYFEKYGVTFLRDRAVYIDGRFVLAGREDLSGVRITGKQRKTLKDILADVNTRYPIVLMDHQPFHLEEATDNNVDIELSGHTHHGQLWPFNIVTNMMYEISRGYKKIDNTHYYVSSGYGTWGPPVRTTARPELVFITLKFFPKK